MKNYYILFGAALLLLLSSCSSFHIEKRHYNNGWYVDFGNASSRETREEFDCESDLPDSEASVIVSDNVAVESYSPGNNPLDVTLSGAPAATELNDLPSKSAPGENESNETEREAKPEAGNESSTTFTDTPESSTAADTRLIIEFILALLLPPLAIYLHEGVTTRFWIDLICFLFVITWFSPFAYGGILHLFAIVFAILIVLDVI